MDALVSIFCRHNRLEQNCTICQRERAPAPRRARATKPSSPRRGGVVTRKLPRATDDGYGSALIPGVRATSDAARLADALAVAAARLEFPGPHPEVAELDPATALGRAFALAGGTGTWDPGRLTDDPSWTPQRRFARLFDRLRLPGFGRAQRFEFLVILGAAGQADVEAGQLFFDVKGNDPTTLAAKRALSSGDALLLERRARELAEAAGVPLAALDRGLALWDSTAPLDAAPDVRAALRA